MRYLLDDFFPGGRLSFLVNTLVLDEDDLLGNPILHISDPDIGSFLNTLQRSRFLLQAIIFRDSEEEAQNVDLQEINIYFMRAFRELLVVGLDDRVLHVLCVNLVRVERRLREEDILSWVDWLAS
jgi:hypothetical protein